MATQQAFVDGVARLSKKGALAWDSSGVLRLADEYTVVLPHGTRPLGYDFTYQDGTHTYTVEKNVTGIPARGSAHPSYAALKATSISWAQPDAASKVWTCMVEYTYSPSTSSGGGETPETPNPKARDADFYTNTISAPLLYCVASTSGMPASLTNTAGEPFNPEPMVDIASPCIRLTVRNTNQPSTYKAYMGTVNSAAITICGIYFPKFTARLTYSSREVEVETSGGSTTTKYEHTFNIEGCFMPCPGGGVVAGSNNALSSVFDRTDGGNNGYYTCGWIRLVPNMGYSYLDANGNLTRAQVQSASDPSIMVDSPMPVKLDSDGHLAAANAPMQYFLCPSGPLASWASLGLPTTW